MIEMKVKVRIKLIEDDGGVVKELLILTVLLLTILFAYTYFVYPFVALLNNTATTTNLYTPESQSLFNNALMAFSAGGLIIGVGGFIWLLARFAKREEFEWLR